MKKIKILFAFALVAIATTVTLSSFSGKETNKADAKPFAIITKYYNAGVWQDTPPAGAVCGFSGTFCSLEYDNTGVTRSSSAIIADAQAAYDLSSNPAGGTVQVRATANPTPLVTVTITEKVAP